MQKSTLVSVREKYAELKFEYRVLCQEMKQLRESNAELRLELEETQEELRAVVSQKLGARAELADRKLRTMKVCADTYRDACVVLIDSHFEGLERQLTEGGNRERDYTHLHDGRPIIALANEWKNQQRARKLRKFGSADDTSGDANAPGTTAAEEEAEKDNTDSATAEGEDTAGETVAGTAADAAATVGAGAIVEMTPVQLDILAWSVTTHLHTFAYESFAILFCLVWFILFPGRTFLVLTIRTLLIY